MKKTILLLILAVFISIQQTYSQIDMSIFGGLSTPSANLGEVYNDNSDVQDLVSKGIDLGWHLGARMRLPIDTGLFFFAGFAWHRFPNAQIEVKKYNPDSTFQIEAQQDIIPISAGLQYYITKNIVRFYLIGQLSYNYFTTHGKYIGLPAPNFDLNDAVGRGGFEIGAGVVFNLVLVYPFLEFSYAMPNVVGRASGEPVKQYYNLSLGLNF